MAGCVRRPSLTRRRAGHERRVRRGACVANGGDLRGQHRAKQACASSRAPRIREYEATPQLDLSHAGWASARHAALLSGLGWCTAGRRRRRRRGCMTERKGHLDATHDRSRRTGATAADAGLTSSVVVSLDRRLPGDRSLVVAALRRDGRALACRDAHVRRPGAPRSRRLHRPVPDRSSPGSSPRPSATTC